MKQKNHLVELFQKSNVNKGLNAGAGGKPQNVNIDDFDFGSDSTQSSPTIITGLEKEDIMKKSYKIDDIHGNDHGNIFQIIHNRYQTSGMRKLFEEEEK